MAVPKKNRCPKKRWGQFMTPPSLSREIVQKLTLTWKSKVLEPSFGDGSFVLNLISKFMEIYPAKQTVEEKLTQILQHNLWGVEIDPIKYEATLNLIKEEFGFLPPHNFYCQDFFDFESEIKFDFIVGNPPFGGTMTLTQQDFLDKKYGKRHGMKIKKETYSFFILKSFDHLAAQGTLCFISADTFLTIKSMKGLRNFLFREGFNQLQSLTFFSAETSYPMVILTHQRGQPQNYLELDGVQITEEVIQLTSHHSWHLAPQYIKYFQGPKLGDYLTASGGLTTGKNEYFLRKIEDQTLIEPYQFTFYKEPITLSRELQKAKLNNMSAKKRQVVSAQEAQGLTVENVKIEEQTPQLIRLPHPAYKYYNKSDGERWASEPKWVIYWAEAGRALRCFKKNGPWYIQGMGGEKFYEEELITWSLVADKIKARYLPPGFILDNSAPVAKVKDREELYFILGWLNSDLATTLQKEVINHTRNIQNKDIERLPYPFWVSEAHKRLIIQQVKKWVQAKQSGEVLVESEVKSWLSQYFQEQGPSHTEDKEREGTTSS